MRIAVIGLGGIARKAYLPVITARADVELVFCTRDRGALEQLSRAHRVAEAVDDVDALSGMKVDAAFVHTATESHVGVAGKLLREGIHVYVDKPIAYTYEESRALVESAEQAGLILMVGFNRRFAPAYQSLGTKEDRRLVIMQKNRAHQPDDARRFVFDDFIHVADTLRSLAPGDVRGRGVSYHTEGGRLHHLLLRLEGEGFTAVGLMNRDSGADEETLELMSPGNKWVVRDLDATVHYSGGEEHRTSFGGWEPILARRGFPQIVDHFLDCVRRGGTPTPSARDSLETHALCEWVVEEIERGGGA